jgi:hypothetical protein
MYRGIILQRVFLSSERAVPVITEVQVLNGLGIARIHLGAGVANYNVKLQLHSIAST